jgi:riboflavin synthase
MTEATGRLLPTVFTGIVEHLGTVIDVTDGDRGRRLTIDPGPLGGDLDVGASVAVDGTCLTVTHLNGGHVAFDVTGETLDRTTLGRVSRGDEVNLERPMAAAGRFDGHIVQGHVDGVGTVRSVVDDGDGSRRMWVDVAPTLLRYVVEKGSITVDGTSLTVATVDESGFEIALIPHTLEVTTLGRRGQGDAVNLEVDVLAKYVERLLGART